MAVEIERKFLVDERKWRNLQKPDGTVYRQGYISNDPAKTVRIRVGNSKGFLAIKGANAGVSRLEFEYEIPLADARQLLKEFCTNIIEKRRYRISAGDKIWEVDEFFGENEGLVVAEIELTHEEEIFERPDWVSREVSGDKRYYNSHLAVFPYRKWNEK